MKFGQLKEYKMKNIFLEKPYTKYGEETSSNLFLKNQNSAYVRINSLKFYTVCVFCMPSSGLSEDNETKLQTIYFYLIESSFVKQKEVWK